jgi:hypothetical protein
MFDRAIAAWKKAGFQPVKEHEPDEEHTVSLAVDVVRSRE